MNATKRKFNSLLQGLSSPSPGLRNDEIRGKTDLPGLSSARDTPSHTHKFEQKRRRLTQTGQATLESNGPSSASNNVRQSAVVGRNSHNNTLPSGDALAKYCPSDREQMLGRLATFQELTEWTPKPEEISEFEWAKRGWVCKGRERVRCVLCHKEVVILLRAEDTNGTSLAGSEVEDSLVDNYAEMIVEAHQADCLWRRRGCENNILRISLASSRASVNALKLRYTEVYARKQCLPPNSTLSIPSGMDLDKILTILPPVFFSGEASLSEASASESPIQTALALALSGWQGLSNPRIGSVLNSLSCQTCLRRLGLWMFQSKKISADGGVVVPAPMDHLDPIREHRFFCPWRNSQFQDRGASSFTSERTVSMAGWELLLQTLTNEDHLRKVYEGHTPSRPKSDPVGSPASAMTAGRVTEAEPSASSVEPTHNVEADSADTHEVEDRERWARLRRVKSLFETKNGSRFRRHNSRPGSSYDTFPRQAD